MKAIINVSEVLHEGAITGRHSGRMLREAVAAASKAGSKVQMDFSGVDVITQSAADEFIGRIVRHSPEVVQQISFSNCSRNVAAMLQWAAEHADALSHAEQSMAAA